MTMDNLPPSAAAINPSIPGDRSQCDAPAEQRSLISRGGLLCLKLTRSFVLVVIFSLAPTLATLTISVRDADSRGADASAAVVNLTGLNQRLRPNDETTFSAPLQTRSGNPIVSGWYADPEARVFQGAYWIYPTYSAPYDQQVFMDAFSSKDLITWQKHSRILDTAGVKWARRALWAPSVVAKQGWYYLFFGANDIQNDSEPGGIGVARARRPGGPFKDYLGKPLIDKFHNGAQPIDPFVFKDTDGSRYLIYGGWKHCNIAKLNSEFNGFVPFPDGKTFKEITPRGYVEGSFMFVKDGKYYFMWSEGGWTGPDYAVAYAIGSSPLGPFERIGKILQQDPSVATGAGHHSVLHAPGSSKWYIVYHRRPLGESDPNHRVVCIDEMQFDERGLIKPVTITREGVTSDRLE
jgi:beta-xylosidase